ncbi:MAG TPA: hypothetical protein VNL98_00125 [Gemmatimonadales bacterium]|nr:hypothetical protein [Gemmatimonadales bacterium]
MNRLARAAAALAAAALAACSPALRQGATPPERTEPDATPLAGRWTGTYTCGQGETGLTLTITPGVMGQLEARFEFRALPSNPSVPSGEYWMAGWVTTDGHVALVGVEWIRQPPNYIMVGLWGRLSADRRRFSGIVPECAAPFSLVRQ